MPQQHQPQQPQHQQQPPTAIPAKASGPRTITIAHGPLHRFCGWGLLKLPPGSATRMLSSGANELLFHISKGQLLLKVGDGMGKPTAATVARGGMVHVRPGNWFALENTSRTHFARAAFWHAKRKRKRRLGGGSGSASGSGGGRNRASGGGGGEGSLSGLDGGRPETVN
jgi:uncharacterized membrane protein YgcG